MRLIFIYGLPATGKLTVARELAQLTGYKLFHNHLAVDLLLPVFDFGSEPFVALREEIWLAVFEQACRAQLPGLIFTFAPESTVRPGFVAQAHARVEGAGSTVSFIELTCPLAEVKRRLGNPSRHQFGKLTSAALLDELNSRGVFTALPTPAPQVTIDTSECTPAEAAAEILRRLGLAG